MDEFQRLSIEASIKARIASFRDEAAGHAWATTSRGYVDPAINNAVADGLEMALKIIQEQS
jgi:hypothetical protein